MANRRPGQPTKLTPKMKQQIEFLAKKGFTDAEMASAVGVTEQTINNWKKQDVKFFEALKGWKAVADRRVERALYERAIGYEAPEDKIFNSSGKPLVVPTTKHYPPDTVAAIFWLKNRQRERWRDKQEIDVNTGAQIPNIADDMTEEEAAELYKNVLG